MAVRLVEVSGLEGDGEAASCETRAEIEAWISAHERGEPRCYDLHADGGGVRFVLGEGWRGWIFAVEGSAAQMWTLEEGPRDAAQVEVWMDGERVPVSGPSVATRERLIEVLAHYITGTGRPAGRWVDDHGAPERAPAPAPHSGAAPAARGRYVRALVAAMAQQPQRPEPDAATLALIAGVRDDDMGAYLYAAACCAYLSGLRLYDFWPERPQLRGRRIWLGTLASGEEVFFEGGQVIFRDDEGHRYRFRGLNGFLDEWWYKAQERGEETSMDEFLE